MTEKSLDAMWLQTQVSDLERRLEMVERFTLGQSQKLPHQELLVSLYLDSLRGAELDKASSRHWERQIFVVDARQLLVIARILRDPFPWRPLLVVADLYVSNGFGLEAARDHLLGVAQELLRIQGLGRVHPRDVMGKAPPTMNRFFAISS